MTQSIRKHTELRTNRTRILVGPHFCWATKDRRKAHPDPEPQSVHDSHHCSESGRFKSTPLIFIVSAGRSGSPPATPHWIQVYRTLIHPRYLRQTVGSSCVSKICLIFSTRCRYYTILVLRVSGSIFCSTLEEATPRTTRAREIRILLGWRPP